MKRRLPPPCPVWGAAPSGYGRMMRGRVISRSPFGDPEVSNGFMRGFISAGLVAVTAGSMPARKEAPPETRNAPAPVDITVQPGDAEVTGNDEVVHHPDIDQRKRGL